MRPVYESDSSLNGVNDPLTKIVVKQGIKAFIFQNSSPPVSTGRTPILWIDQIIIHINGGAFISSNSKLHSVYLRKIAKKTGFPIFSIDYWVPPMNTFPDALDDVWQAYNWILRYGTQHLGITPAWVYLLGDSAGGNLALGLVNLCLLHGFWTPNKVILSYPICNVDYERIFPSYLYSFKDPAFNSNLISHFTREYS